MASFPAVLAAEQGWAVSQDHQQCEQLFQDCQAKERNFTYLWKLTSNLIIKPSQLNGKLNQERRKIGWNCYFVYYCTVFTLWDNTTVQTQLLRKYGLNKINNHCSFFLILFSKVPLYFQDICFICPSSLLLAIFTSGFIAASTLCWCIYTTRMYFLGGWGNKIHSN